MKFRASRFCSLLGAFLLFSCASEPTKERSPSPVKPPESTVAAFSHFGSDFTVDVISRSLLRPKETSLDISPWGLDSFVQGRMETEARELGLKAKALSLDVGGLEKALHARESRWKKFLGKYNQALVDFLLDKASQQKVDFLFLLSPVETRDSFPLFKGNMGIYCYNRKLRKERAYAYFFGELTVWDVKERKKVFHRLVDPSSTQEMTFAECQEVAELKEPQSSLREPVLHTAELLVKEIFGKAAEKLGWKESVPEPEPDTLF